MIPLHFGPVILAAPIAELRVGSPKATPLDRLDPRRMREAEALPAGHHTISGIVKRLNRVPIDRFFHTHKRMFAWSCATRLALC